MEELLTYTEASEMLRLKRGTLHALVSQARIPHIRLGGRLVRFSRTALQQWLNERTVVPTNARFNKE